MFKKSSKKTADNPGINIDLDIADAVCEKLKEEYEKMGKVNIIIAGKTGVGKSTLINAMFGKKMAETSVGTPCTQNITKYETPDSPLVIYDNVGFEMRNTDEVIKETKDLINTQRKSGDSKNYIHCIWYCIQGVGAKIEPAEIEIIKEFAKIENVPVIVVITKSFGKESKELESFINRLNLPIKKCIRVLAQDYIFDTPNGPCTIPAFGCDELADFTVSILPESAQTAFINAQTANLKLKQSKARLTMRAYAVTAFAEGFIPLPFADAAVLVPTQVAMISSIANVYGIKLKRSTIAAILTSVLGTSLSTMLGKTIVSNILKFIPGAGTTVGGTISGAIASIITVSLGNVFITIMDKLATGEITEKALNKRKELKKIQKDYRNELASPKEL